MNTITIKDETASGKILHEILLQFDEQYITVRELITERIREEVEKYKQDISSYKRGLVMPANLEKRLNQKADPVIDIEKQVYIALDAFLKNGFFILVDDEQVDELEQKFMIDDTTKVSFIKLTPLVGG